MQQERSRSHDEIAARAFLYEGATLQGMSATDPRIGAEVARLEKQVAREGQPDLARELHGRRCEADERRALQILSARGGDPKELLGLAKRVAGEKELGLARRLLKRARAEVQRSEHPKLYFEIFQKSALYTYKDPDLPLDWRLEHALDILGKVEDLKTTTNAETLGLVGAIYKRKWEVDPVRAHLEQALFFYRRGYATSAPASACGDPLGHLERNPTCRFDATIDRGYTGINAAFVLDLLASQEEEEASRAGTHSEAARRRRASAQAIRQEILRSVPPLLDVIDNKGVRPHAWLQEEWWFYATIAEAYFGLGHLDPQNFAHAVDWLVTRPERAGLERRLGAVPRGGFDVPEWEYESTARQLARLAMLQGTPDQSVDDFQTSPAGQALKAILRNDDEAVRSACRGKFGVALSGGGFRAALFHIGVLASLAEHGVLSQIEVLSCVSGGSIIGAHYYLELRRLLQTSTDGAIRPADYVEIVARIERRFLKGVQRNIRMRVLAELTTNLKMIFQPSYSRTMRVGELYERELFSQVDDGGYVGWKWLPDWLVENARWPLSEPRRRRKRWLNELFIHPKVGDGDGAFDTRFSPRSHNWRRINKVPTLILNATSLNSGHCWQFTASFMGEPPGRINTAIDANDRLRRMYYRDAPTQHQRVRLGHAVAASSCVPGLFEPLILDQLYPDYSVRLVDGGVCDNQGSSSLLEQDCTVLIVSDASGQMDNQLVPPSGVIGVPLRANDILQARVREAQYIETATRRRSQLLRGLLFLHLKQDLAARSVPWREIPPNRELSDFAPASPAEANQTSYDVDGPLQRKLAAIRTDLDSFTEVEACALMLSGYRMTNAQLVAAKPSVPGFAAIVAEPAEPWRFRQLDDALQPRGVGPDSDARRRRVARILDAGAARAFKVWVLSRLLVVVKWLLAAALVGAAAWSLYVFREKEILSSLVPGSVSKTTFGALGFTVVGSVLTALLAFVLNRVLGERFGSGVMKAIQWRSTLRSVLIGAAMAAGGFLVARVHLHIFDRWFLRIGRIDKLPPRSTGDASR